MGKVAPLRPRHRFAYRDTAPPANPVDVYLSRFQSAASVTTMRHSLEVCARLLTEAAVLARDLDWPRVGYADLLTLRSQLLGAYKPHTAQKHLQGAKGVLKECWRLGRLSIEDYHRCIDLPPIRGATVPPGRQLEPDEIQRLFAACWADPSPRSVRMLAMLAVFLGTGCRRAELVALRMADYDTATGRLLLRGKGAKERHAWLGTETARGYLSAWLALRGAVPGPLFTTLDKYGHVRAHGLGYYSIAFLLDQLAERAAVRRFSAHDFRRTAISNWWDAGIDGVTIQRLVGHADVRQTARYDRRPERTQIAAAATVRLPVKED